jgi:flagellar basal-body rod protein FlgF
MLVEGEQTMQIGVSVAALGSREQQKRLEVLANNLANSATPGFKKDVVRFADFLTETTLPQINQGTVRATAHPLDIALSGEGFLRVQAEKGTLYTRAGNLMVNKEGFLATQDGLPVLGRGGPIHLSSPNPKIDPNGDVYDRDQNVGTLDLVQFPQQTGLVKTNGGYFKPADETQRPEPAKACTVQQGAIEEANFNIVQEMALMIDTMRTFEAHHKIIRSFEQIDSLLVNKLALP